MYDNIFIRLIYKYIIMILINPILICSMKSTGFTKRWYTEVTELKMSMCIFNLIHTMKKKDALHCLLFCTQSLCQWASDWFTMHVLYHQCPSTTHVYLQTPMVISDFKRFPAVWRQYPVVVCPGSPRVLVINFYRTQD